LFPVPYDKLAHSLYFATLSLLLWFGTVGRWPVLLFVAVSAIGGLDELNQATLPGRQAGFDDFLTDMVAAGVVIAVLEKYKAWLTELRYGKNGA
ncbi:MAG: VanZ family protein, partial [Pseudomonadota bacterium]